MTMKLLKASEVADILNLNEDRVYALAREGILPACRLGRQLRWSLELLEEFIRRGGKSWNGGWRKEA